MTPPMHKYPRTRHIEGSRLQPGDEDLSAAPWAEIAGRHLVIEEKMDGANCGVSFSPDGKQLAVVHLDRGNYRIAIIDLASRALQVLTEGRQDESPSFAPNGATLIYATQDRGRGVLATVSVDGRVQQRLTANAGDVREPVWGPFPTR